MKLKIVLLSLFTAFLCHSQGDIFYKVVNDEFLSSFSNDSSAIYIDANDSISKYKNYFNYVLKFYPNLEFKKITIRSGKGDRFFSVSSKKAAGLKAARSREYVITISMQAKSHMDTALFCKLTPNAKVGMIAKQFGLIKEYSTSDFFQVMGLHFRKKGGKSKQLNKDITLYAIESGLGYQLMSASNEIYDRLLPDYWRNKKDYKQHYPKIARNEMTSDVIHTYMEDYAIYQQHTWK